MKKILIIAPLPPPITGQSFAVEYFTNNLPKEYCVEYLNLSQGKLNYRFNAFRRTVGLLKLFLQLPSKLKKVDIIYFNISESVFGNIKDLIIFLICFRNLNKMVIHLHGGAGYSEILKIKLLFIVNKFFINKIKSVIVLGDTFKPLFNYLPSNKIHVVKNFALKEIVINKEEIIDLNFDDNIKIIFISNLLPGKGYIELLQAYKDLPVDIQNKISIDFAGAFQSIHDEIDFRDDISDLKNIKYWGVVKGQLKLDLFKSADIFCLPTYYPFEGQPISIIEAYASGCCVITTNHSGIFDIFKPEHNGFVVEKESSDSIRNTLIEVINNPKLINSIKRNNVEDFKKMFTEDIHLSKMISSVFE